MMKDFLVQQIISQERNQAVHHELPWNFDVDTPSELPWIFHADISYDFETMDFGF